MIPFVTPTLRLAYLPAALAPPSLAVYLSGSAPAYRLTPAVYAHLHHAADRIIARGTISHADALSLVSSLSAVYDALIASGINPRDVNPWGEGTPPLPAVPPLPHVDDGSTSPPSRSPTNELNPVSGGGYISKKVSQAKRQESRTPSKPPAKPAPSRPQAPGLF